MLDTHTATPGIMVAGCHESQTNFKALKVRCPWMFGITSVIKHNIRRKRGVPTYSVLFNEAKNFIRAMRADPLIHWDPDCKGPSPNELKPIPREQYKRASHQDPQLIFFSTFIDPSEEGFLCPFVAPSSSNEGGDVTRFPRDEYPHGGEL